MRTACSTSIVAVTVLLLSGCTREPPHAGPATISHLAARTDSGRTVFTWSNSTGTSASVAVARDSTVATTAAPVDASIAGEVPGTALLVIDSYASIAGGMSYCQAGEERFLRVISIATTPPTETYRVKLASCRDNIELASDSVAWNAASSELRIHWLSGPNAAHSPESKTVRIDAKGKVQPQ
jgi:hypothetical protein